MKRNNIAGSKEATMNDHRLLTTRARLVFLVAVSVVALVSLVKLTEAKRGIGTADLAGPWATTLTGDTGCGISTMWVTFTLNAAGSASDAAITSHTSGCGDGTTTGLSFTINTLNPNGSGTANLSCGPGCGWNLNIQVSPDLSIFNVVDVSPENPGNFLEGVAIRQ